MNPKQLLEQRKVPCGPMAVNVDGVCRRKLPEKLNVLLDRLTHETHPEYVKPEAPKGFEFDSDGNLVNTAERMQKDKEKALSKALQGAKKNGFQESATMGNSKLLQDLTGALPSKEGKTKQPQSKK